MSIRVFSRKTFEFAQYVSKDGMQTRENRVTVRPAQVVDLPDWVKGDPLFSWAVKDGDLSIMQSVEQIGVVDVAAMAAAQREAELAATAETEAAVEPVEPDQEQPVEPEPDPTDPEPPVEPTSDPEPTTSNTSRSRSGRGK
jgi:hypothetical protein